MKSLTRQNFAKQNLRGFTLIELLIYVAILAAILVLLTGFLWTVVFGNIKESSFQEVQQNGRFALTKISQEIKRATGINNPLAGDSPSNLLSLSMAGSSLNPTVFDLDDGKLRITQGNPGVSYYLTADQAIINELQFTNLSYDNTPGIIRIEMEISHINPENRVEYQASAKLTSSISLLPGGAAPPPDFCAGACTSCSDILDKKTCDEQDGCSWDKKLKICLDDPGCTPCDSYTTESDCIAQDGCQWVMP